MYSDELIINSSAHLRVPTIRYTDTETNNITDTSFKINTELHSSAYHYPIIFLYSPAAQP